jgi:hypothetical protein
MKQKRERFIRREEALILLDGLYRMTVMADNLPVVTLSPDPDDNKIIATAIAGSADYLVSGDKGDLLVFGPTEATP